MKTLAMNLVAADVSPLHPNTQASQTGLRWMPFVTSTRGRLSRMLSASGLGAVSLAILFALGLTLANNALAASATWTGLGADSAWTTTGNWSTSPVPGAGDTATFNGAGNSKTAITTAPASLYSYLFDSASCAAYTISGATTTWAVPDGGGISINNSVTTAQDLSGIQFVRLTNGTVNFINQGSGLLKIGTCFNANSVANSNMRLNFAPAGGSTIEIASGKVIDNASTAGRTTSILVSDAGTVKMTGTGSYSGPDADGNALTIRQGTFSVAAVTVSGGRSTLGGSGRIQFGEAAQTRTATLQYTATTAQSTDRPFYIIDNNTARFDITEATGNLTLATNITQSAATLGGGHLTKIGAGTLTLTGTNLHTGDTLVSAGTLVVSNNFALTNSAFDTSGAGTLSLPAAVTTPTFGGLKGSSALTLPATVTSLTLNPGSGKTPAYSGTLSGGTLLGLVKTGAGTQTLGGSNSFGNNVTITAGTLKLAHSHALGTNAIGLLMQGISRVLQLSGGITLGTNITLHLSSNSGDGAGVASVDGDNEIKGFVNFTTGNPALNFSSAAGALTLSGGINLSTTTRTLYFGGASAGNNTVSGPITESGGVLSVVKQGAGKWIFRGTNTYTGNTTINGGTLALSGSGSIANTPVITVAGGATFDVSGLISSPFALGASQTLINSGATTASLAGNFNTGLGAVILTNSAGTPSLTVSGAFTLASGTTFTVHNAGAQLAHGSYKLIAKTGGGAVSGSVPSVSVTGGGAAAPVSLQIVGGELYLNVNHAPTASAATCYVAQGGSVTITNNPGKKPFVSDADADALTYAVVSGPAHGTVGVIDNGFTYASTGNAAGITDTFQYSVSDGFGGAATNTITVYIGSAEGANLISSTASEGLAYLTYAGIPGRAYVCERATNLTPPAAWTPVATNTAGAIDSANPGRFSFTNTIVPPTSFFRTQAE